MPGKADFEEFFDQADKDKNGYLTGKELAGILKSFGYKLTNAEVKRVFKSIDTSGDNKISKEEFVAAMDQEFPPKEHDGAAMRKVFQSFDKDGNNKIDRKELQEALAELGSRLPDSDIQLMMNVLDKDKSGTLDYEEFIAIFQQTKKY